MGPCTPPQARSPLQKVKSQRWPTQEAKASVRWHRSPRRRWLQARLALASGFQSPLPAAPSPMGPGGFRGSQCQEHLVPLVPFSFTWR